MNLVLFIISGSIRVYCRVRPFLPGQSSNVSSIGHIEDGNIKINTPLKYGKEGHKYFSFNKVFGTSATQGYHLFNFALYSNSISFVITMYGLNLNSCVQMKYLWIHSLSFVLFWMVIMYAFLHMDKLVQGRHIQW